jgi:hypothetical protein
MDALRWPCRIAAFTWGELLSAGAFGTRSVETDVYNAAAKIKGVAGEADVMRIQTDASGARGGLWTANERLGFCVLVEGITDYTG